MLTKRIGATAVPDCSANWVKSRVSWVQASTSSSPLSSALRNAPASRRHRVLCSVRVSLRDAPRLLASSGIVWLQSQISVVMVYDRLWGLVLGKGVDAGLWRLRGRYLGVR